MGKKLLRLLYCFTPLLVLAVFSLLTVEVSATEFNQAGIVDSFSLPERTKRSNTAEIKVKFSSKTDYQIKQGDTLTLTLPTHLIGTKANDIPVVGNDNVQYGSMTVFGDSVVVTFNDKVSNYKSLTGSLTIPVIGAINVDTEGEAFVDSGGQKFKELTLSSNLGTDLSDKTYKVWENVYEPGTGNAKMYSKVGTVKNDYSYDVIEYQLQVKAKEYDVEKDIVLTDTLDEHQYYPNESELLIPKKISFMEIVYRDDSGEKNMSIADFEANGYGTFTLIDKSSFKMIFNQEKLNGNKVNLYYRAKLTDKAKIIKPEHVKNFSTETYKIDGQAEITEPQNATPPVSYPDATARPTKGTLWIIKKKQVGDAAWAEQALLPGVVFNIYKEDGSILPNGQNLVTDKDGRIILPDLLPGKYYAQEISAPADVLFDPSIKYDFTIDESAKFGVILAISNPAVPPKGEFTASKKADKKILHPGETFTYTISVTNTVLGSTLKNLMVEDTMPEGIEVVGDLKLNGNSIGTVTGNSIKVTIPELKGDETAEITFVAKASEGAQEGEVINIATVTDPEDPEHPKKPEEKVEIIRELDLRLMKTGMDGKTVLKDAVFEIYQLVDGQDVLKYTLTSDLNGQININKLKSGTYTIKEKNAPNGFQLLDKSINITIDKYGVLKLIDTLSGMVSLDKLNNTFQLTVKNEEVPQGGVLPQTGGEGPISFTVTAVFFMITALSLFGYYVYRTRKGWN